MLKHTTDTIDLNYWTSGNKPRLIIHSGTHGDESEVTEFVWKAIRKYQESLPEFIFVPAVSPSAVARKTRENSLGNDLNRNFFDDSKDPEIVENLNIIRDKKVDLFVSFHEDPLIDEYYVYDIGHLEVKNNLVLAHNKNLQEKGIKMLNGIDDFEDPGLGYNFVNGYNITVYPKNKPDNGSISSWLFNRNITNEYLLPEIPGMVDRDVKEMIVDTFFSDVILKMF